MMRGRIEIWDREKRQCKAVSEGSEPGLFYRDRYEEGDFILLSGLVPGKAYRVRLDACLDEVLLYAKKDSFRYEIPFGEAASTYPPMAFTKGSGLLYLREASPEEDGAYRNLALNPYDQHGETGIFPHAHANVETRGEAVFAAKNAIDGVKLCQGHGRWPYQSWGINRRADAEWHLEFGRPVDLRELVLYTRAECPHDNWWVKAELSFSDGSSLSLDLEKRSGEGQHFPVDKKGIRSLCLRELIPADDPSPFPALTELEAYGYPSR